MVLAAQRQARPRTPARAVLIVKLAAELYRRERGKPPISVESLLGSYLKELPDGIEQYEPIPDGID